MGVDMKDFVKDRDAAFTAFVLHDDWEPVLEYCRNYGVPIPDDPRAAAAGVYKAVQYITNMPDEVKVKAAMKCMKLGFTPFMRPFEPKEDA